ncbi:hypothetical protein [Anaerovorax sp. IOR16]|uniref:hypothetical protein n=1 Tax=Anaerovorax sp. IOR16 TaxID=2773458 RepID=UPI0019D053A2|nr:hypothetical protein [Anaerovorax sp. IOR16]
MMIYDKTIWVDHVVDSDTGEVIQQGTPISENRLNKSEDGIFENRELTSLEMQQILELKRNAENFNVEIGSVTLSNSQAYPFNNSKITIALKKPRNSLDYEISTELVSSNGEAGDVIVSDKQTNGFKLEFTGSATAATVKYFVKGGIYS